MEAFDEDKEHEFDLKLLVQQYEEMLRKDTVSFLELDRFLMLSEYYEQEEQLVLALGVIVHAMKQHPYSASLLVRKAQLLCEQQQYEVALELLETATLYEPSDLDIYLTKADVYMRMLQPDKALKAIRGARSYVSEEELPDIFLLESTIYETLKDYTNALKYLKRALKKDPSNDIALSRIWNIYDATRDYADAVAFHIDFINENPYSHWAWYNLGVAYVYVGSLEKAAEAFDYAIVINDQFEIAYHYYIDCLIELEDLDLALRYLNEYLEIFEPDAEILYRFGQCYELREEYSKAREYHVQALQISNLGGRVYYSIGNCYMEEDIWDLAEKAFMQAYEVDNFNEVFCLALADAYDVLDNSEKAHEFYHKALAIAPKDANIWVHYIEFLIDEESYVVAFEMLDEARKLIEDVILDYAYAAVLLESGQRQEGFVVLGQALMDNFELHNQFFQIAPNLEDDETIVAFIMNYKEE